MKKIIISILTIVSLTSLFTPLLTLAAPFFKDKEVLHEIPAVTDDPITKSIKLNTHYRINKITGTDLSYTRYVNGVMDMSKENKTVSTTVFDDNKKYAVSDVEYLPITLGWNAATKKWSITSDMFFTKSDAAAALTDFVFAPLDMNGKPWGIKVDDAALVRKSKM